MHTPTPVDEEYRFTNGLVISSTNLNGIITYSNRLFREVSGYTRDELLDKNHNIVRHPDVPKSIYKNLWQTIQKGKPWSGTIKNLRKDGKYYWVHTYITPIIDKGDIIGYAATRRPASAMEITEAIENFKNKQI